MNKIFDTFLLSFKSVFRNLKSSAIIFILPVVFMAIFGLAFGGETNIRFELGIYQPDQSEFKLQEIFQEASDTSENLEIKIKNYDDLKELKGDVEKNLISIGVSLPNSLSSGAEFELLLQQNDTSSQINSSVIVDIINQTIFQGQNINRTITNPDKESLSVFDLLAPGLIVYGLIMLIPSIAQSFSQISENKYIFRYAFSKISAMEIILGNVLFYFCLGLIQAIILYNIALLFGYQASGSLALAVVPILLTLFFVIAVGLLIGGMFKKSESATNIGTIINIILGFFSGAFISGIGNILIL